MEIVMIYDSGVIKFAKFVRECPNTYVIENIKNQSWDTSIFLKSIKKKDCVYKGEFTKEVAKIIDRQTEIMKIKSAEIDDARKKYYAVFDSLKQELKILTNPL